MKKKPTFFVFKKYGKFGSISLEHFIKYKLLISEEWGYNQKTKEQSCGHDKIEI